MSKGKTPEVIALEHECLRDLQSAIRVSRSGGVQLVGGGTAAPRDTARPGAPWFSSRENLAALVRWMDQGALAGGTDVTVRTVLELLQHPEDFEDEWQRCCEDERAEIARLDGFRGGRVAE